MGRCGHAPAGPGQLEQYRDGPGGPAAASRLYLGAHAAGPWPGGSAPSSAPAWSSRRSRSPAPTSRPPPPTHRSLTPGSPPTSSSCGPGSRQRKSVRPDSSASFSSAGSDATHSASPPGSWIDGLAAAATAMRSSSSPGSPPPPPLDGPPGTGRANRRARGDLGGSGWSISADTRTGSAGTPRTEEQTWQSQARQSW
jgi:hypothetical protein